MITNSVNYDSFSSLDSLLDKYSKQYDNISLLTIDDIVFILRPLTRKEFREIDENTFVGAVEKKDFICKTCMLYPPNFDLDNCSAGIPEQIYEKIVDISCLKREDMLMLLEHYRGEMEYLENQMACTIAMAFPAYKYDEIDNMTMIDFCKMYSRAEWIINNKDIKLNDIIELIEEALYGSEDNEHEYYDDVDEYDSEEKEDHTKYRDDSTNQQLEELHKKKGNRPIDKMTDEQKQAMNEFYKKYPQFNQSTDYVYSGEVRTEYKDPPALRPNFGRRR